MNTEAEKAVTFSFSIQMRHLEIKILSIVYAKDCIKHMPQDTINERNTSKVKEAVIEEN